jgi:MoxR-like ATPase
MMKVNTNTIVEKLQASYPDQTIFRKAVIVDTAKSLGFSKADWSPLLEVKSDVRGQYDLSSVIVPLRQKEETNSSTLQMQSIVNQEKSYAKADPTFVPWGPFKDITQILKSEMFYPTYISGLSGNGKTFMVEQSCAKLNREFIRVQINPETDEDDLIGGFRLINGETVFAKGPVLKAMENGAVLLLDEIDRATNKIMCLQGILEGKPVVVKKTGETITPQPGFNVIATANTKGKGSDDGRFTAASIIDEAFLERFTISIDQQFPSPRVEQKIVMKHMAKFDAIDGDFAENLVAWADIIRKTFYDDGVDEVISTRRLCHIVQTNSIFNDRMKAIDLCIARFDDDTKEAFLDLYSKVDAGVDFNEEQNVEETDEDRL